MEVGPEDKRDPLEWVDFQESFHPSSRKVNKQEIKQK